MAEPFPPFAFTSQESWYGELSFKAAESDAALSLAGRQFVMAITPAASGASLVEPVLTLTMASGGGLSLKVGDPSTLVFRVPKETANNFPRGEFTGDVLEVVGSDRYLFMPVRITYAEPSGLRAYLSRFFGVSVSFASRQQPIYTPLAVPGREGRPGATIINGTVAPVPADGRDGDFFIEDRGAGRGRRMYGPKTGGAWPGTPWNIQVAAISDVPGLPKAIEDSAQRAANLGDLTDKAAAFQNLGIPAALAENWAGTLSLREAARRAGVTIAADGVLTGDHITGTISGTDDADALKAVLLWSIGKGFTIDGGGLTLRLEKQIVVSGAGTFRLQNTRFLMPATLSSGVPNHQPFLFVGSSLNARLAFLTVIYVGIPRRNGAAESTTIIRADGCRSIHHTDCHITSHSVVGSQILTTDVYDVAHINFTSVKNGDATTGATDFYALGSQNEKRRGRAVFRNCRAENGRGAHSWFYVAFFDEVEIDRVVVRDCVYNRVVTDDVANGVLVVACGTVSVSRSTVDLLLNMSNDASMRVGPNNAISRTKYARGFCFADCDDVVVDGLLSKLVDQTYDFSGSGKGRRVRVFGCTSWQAGSWGLKNANGWQDFGVFGFDSWFPGGAGYVVGDSITANVSQPKNIYCEAVRVYHPGSNRRFDGSDDAGKGFYSGFFINTSQATTGNPGPTGVSIGPGCTAEDTTTAIVSIDADTGGSGLPSTLTLTAPTPAGGRAAILKPRLIDGILAAVEIVEPGLYPAGSYPSGIVPIAVGGVGGGVAPTVRGFLGGNMLFGALDLVPRSARNPPSTIDPTFRSTGHKTATQRGFLIAGSTVNYSAVATANLPAPPSGNGMRLVGADGSSAVLISEAYGAQAFATLRRANGTAAAPTSTKAGEALGFYGSGGFVSGAGFADYTARLNFTAAEDFTSTARGTSVSISSSKRGASSQYTIVTFDPDTGTKFSNAVQIGGADLASRFLRIDGSGQQTQRYDDNGVVTGTILQNFGVTGADQGAVISRVFLGANGSQVAEAGMIRLLTSDTFSSSGSATARWQVLAARAGATFVAIETNADLTTAPMLRVSATYTVATLPSPGVRGRMVHCSNARMLTASGLESSPGSGGLVYDTGSAWRIAGTNITAQA